MLLSINKWCSASYAPDQILKGLSDQWSKYRSYINGNIFHIRY